MTTWPCRIHWKQLRTFTQRHVGPVLPWLLMLAFWTLWYGPRLLESIEFALDRESMNGDARIIHFHFYHWMAPELFANDVLGKHHVDGTSELFRGLFYVAA